MTSMVFVKVTSYFKTANAILRSTFIVDRSPIDSINKATKIKQTDLLNAVTGATIDTMSEGGVHS